MYDLTKYSVEDLQRAWQSAFVIDCNVNTIPFEAYVNRMDAESAIAEKKQKKAGQKKSKISRLDADNWNSTTAKIAEIAKKRKASTKAVATPAAVSREELQARLQQKIEDLRNQRKEREEQYKRDKEARREEREKNPKPERPAKKVKTETAVATPSEDIDMEQDDDVEFGKIITHEERDAKKRELRLNAGVPLPAGSKKKRLLEALDEIKKTDAKIAAAKTPEERAALAREVATERAMARAEGKKLKTDASRVKKSLKLLEEKKKAASKPKLTAAEKKKQEHNNKRLEAHKKKVDAKKASAKEAEKNPEGKKTKSFEDLAKEHKVE